LSRQRLAWCRRLAVGWSFEVERIPNLPVATLALTNGAATSKAEVESAMMIGIKGQTP